MTPNFSLCVYCGSRTGADPRFAQVAAEVGRWIGRHGGQLVYGGGNNGLMGILADAALASGARVVGIIPKSMVEREWAKRDCTELHIVDNMHQRKSMMAERADAFLALPGGIGTFEEFFEVWTWRQLGYHDKPVGLLNCYGFYDGLIAFNRHMVETGFVRAEHSGILIAEPELDPLLERMAGYVPHKPIFQMKADEL